MFLRIVRNNKGVEYLRIVENIKTKEGKRTQKVIANLGRLDRFASKPSDIDHIVSKLIEIFKLRNYINIDNIKDAPKKRNTPLL